MFPDLIAFALPFVRALFGGVLQRYPSSEMVPSYILGMYSVTHSLVIAIVIIAIAFAIWGKRVLPMLAWPLHVVFDIPTHDLNFFPTPYLWPFNTPLFNGIPWSTPWVFFGYWSILIILLIVMYFNKKNGRRRITEEDSGSQRST